MKVDNTLVGLGFGVLERHHRIRLSFNISLQFHFFGFYPYPVDLQICNE